MEHIPTFHGEAFIIDIIDRDMLVYSARGTLLSMTYIGVKFY